MTEPRYLYTTERLGLKPLSSAELNGPYASWFLDAEVNQYNSHFRLPSSEDDVKSFVSGLVGDRSRLVIAVYWLDSHRHIGNVSLQQIDAFNRSAELAFLIGDRSVWGKGVGAEAANALMAHGKKYLAIRRFTLGCLAINTGMNKLAQKLGFSQEGVLAGALWHHGRFEDVNLYGINVED